MRSERRVRYALNNMLFVLFLCTWSFCLEIGWSRALVTPVVWKQSGLYRTVLFLLLLPAHLNALSRRGDVRVGFK